MKKLTAAITAIMATLLMTGCAPAGEEGGGLFGGGPTLIIVYVVIFGALIYFMSIRPQKKEKKAREELMGGLAIGDAVLTTAGFYGVVIDMTDDTVIVEFGNNKNCRIPMQKASIVQVEKPEQAKPVDEQKNEIQK